MFPDIPTTIHLAHVAAQIAGDHSARMHGRIRWGAEDYDAAHAAHDNILYVCGLVALTETSGDEPVLPRAR